MCNIPPTFHALLLPRRKSLSKALGVNLDGRKELLGIWIEQTEGAKFWLQVMTELKNRGVKDIFFACVDGLKGFPEAIEAVFPKTTVQICIVHMVRYSLNFVNWKMRKLVAADLRTNYRAATADEATLRLTEFEENGTIRTRPLGNPGDVTGHVLCRFLTSRPRFAV